MPQDDGFDRPHDRLFRYAFERPEIAEGELRCLLPSAVVDAIDFATLTLEPGSLVDAEYAELETDLLYRVQLAGQDGFLFVPFEHQSSGLGRHIEEIAMTAAERLKAEGRAEGKAEGQAQLLLKLLALRFGALGPEVQARVLSASLEELEIYGERLLSAARLVEVLA